MLSTISWKEYVSFIAIISFLYYTIIYLKYFNGSIRLSPKVKPPAINRSDNSLVQHDESVADNSPVSLNHRHSVQELTYDAVPPPWEEDEFQLYPCNDELNAFFNEYKSTKNSKEEVMLAIQRILSKYPYVKNSDYKDSITNLIVMQCEEVCSFHLNEEEEVRIWYG